MPKAKPLVLTHPTWRWTLDVTSSGVQFDELDRMNWNSIFEQRRALESGAIANTSENRQVGHYWLRDPLMAPTMGQAQAIGETCETLKSAASAIRSGETLASNGLPFQRVLHVGIGGSVLGPRFVTHALANQQTGLPITYIDNIDPHGILRTLDALETTIDSTLVVVASKSGTTIETMTIARIIREFMEKRGVEFRRHFVAITCPGSQLEIVANEESWLHVFHLWNWVGGRFSVTSAVGLFTAELAGIDATTLLDGAREMDHWTRAERWEENPAALLAGVLFQSGKGLGEKNLATIPYSDRLSEYPRYLQQIVMESVGKEKDRDGRVVHQGLTVYGHKGSTDQHATMQQLRDGRRDSIVLFLQSLKDEFSPQRKSESLVAAADYLQGFLLGTRQAMRQQGRPNLLLTLPQIDAYNIGALVAFSERVVSYYADLIRVNGYDQPGVEAGKTAAKEILALRERVLLYLHEQPATLAELEKLNFGNSLDIFYILEREVANGTLQRDAEVYSQND